MFVKVILRCENMDFITKIMSANAKTVVEISSTPKLLHAQEVVTLFCVIID